MNQLFFPNRSKSAVGKTGINRVRKIIKYEKKQRDPKQSPTILNTNFKNNIPDSWFYNKNSAEKVWKKLEQTEKDKTGKTNEESLKMNDDKNPFSKIDKSTNKIRQLLDSFNVSDQEFLLTLMEILDDDAGIDSLDQQSILLEARLRLASMIDEHVDNSDAQSHMLESLRFFFNDYQSSTENDIDNEIINLRDFDSGVDSTQLATLINDACEKNEVCSEQASQIHKAIVDSFNRQMRDLKQEIDTRDKEIQSLQHQIEINQKSRRSRRAEANAKKMKEANQVLAGAQRKICEQETTINNLKSALSAANDDDDGGFVGLSASSSTGSILHEKIINSVLAENENANSLLTSDREIELMSKIHYLTQQVHSLKSELTENLAETKEIKLASIDLNNNYQNLDRAKKLADQTISSLTEKYEFMENLYKKKLSEAENVNSTNNEKSSNQIIADIKIEYENKIASIKEQARQTQQQALDIADKRHRLQMNDMLKSLENSDQSTALSEMMKNHEATINEITERNKKQIIDMKNLNNEKIKSLTKQYESKLIDAFKQNDLLRLSLKDDIAASLLKQKIELDDEFQQKLNSVEADKDDEFEKMKKQLKDKINSVENLNKKLMNERDALRDAIEDAHLVVDIPNAEDEFDDENEEEEEFEEENPENKDEEDVKIFDKNWEDKQIKKVKDEYISLMNQQRENILKTKEWELEQLKKEMMRGFEEQMAENRKNLISDLTDLRSSISESKSIEDGCEQIDNLVANLAKGVEKQTEIVRDLVNRDPMISLHEANERMEELNKKIVQVSTENDFLRNTIGKMTNNRNLKDSNGNDVVKVMRQSIADEAAKINELLIDNENLKKEIAEISRQKEDILKEKEIKQMSLTNSENQKEKLENQIQLLKDKIVDMKEQQSESFSGSVSLPSKPSYSIDNVSNDDYETTTPQNSIDCEHCGEKINIDPAILQVSTIEAPVIECPFCHDVVHVKKDEIKSPFRKEEFNEKQLNQIRIMESEIKQGILNLIEMKKKMREGIDMSNCQHVVKINGKEEKTVTLTPNYDVTVFTLPPNPTTSSKKLTKNLSSGVVNVRSFSPSNSRFFSKDQVDKIIAMEDDIDKKINNLVDYKVKSSSNSNKASDNNLIMVDDIVSLSISKEVFYDSHINDIESLFDGPPLEGETKLSRIISSSKSCDVFGENINRVSFNSHFLKPPKILNQSPDFAKKKDDNLLAEPNSYRGPFRGDFMGTSLDGSSSPFKHPLDHFIKSDSSSQLKPLSLTKKLPPLNGKKGLPPSNAVSLPFIPHFDKPSELSKSSITHIDILPWEGGSISNAHIEKGGNVLARIQNQMLRSQQQQSSQQLQQPQQFQQQKQQQEQQISASFNDGNDKEKVFLTPEADLVSLQLSDVGYFSRRNSRPTSSVQPSREVPLPPDQKGDINSVDKLFEKNKPIGEPKQIEEFRADLEMWKKQMLDLKDQHKSLVNSYNEISSMTHELIQRHDEIVKVLTKALDTAMSLAKGDAEHPEALIEKMQEQSAYLTSTIREKEILQSQSNAQNLEMNEKMQELLQMQNENAEKDQEIEDLQQKFKVLYENEQENITKIHSFEETVKSSKEIEEFQKNQINEMAKKLETECKKNFELQKQYDDLNVQNEQLQNQIAIASKETEVDMTSVEPFVIFSINPSLNLPPPERKYKGFGLQPFTEESAADAKEAKNDEKGENKPASEEKENENKNKKENENENEVIHVSSFKPNKEEDKNSPLIAEEQKPKVIKGSESFDTFRPIHLENEEDKLIYTTSTLKQQENGSIQSTSADQPKEEVKTIKAVSNSNTSSYVYNKNSPMSEIELSSNLSVNRTPVISGRVFESSKAQTLKKRIQQLEASLLQKVNENSEVKEELHVTQQNLFKLTNLNAKIERDMKKAEVSRETAVKKLNASIEMVNTLSTENESLRKLIEQYKQMAQKISKNMKKVSSLDQSNNATLINEMKTRSLLHDIEKASNAKYSLKSFAERQALILARLEGKRRYLQEKEKERLMSVLQAMHLITNIKEPSKNENENEKSINETDKKKQQIGFNVINYNLKKKQTPAKTRADTSNLFLEADRSNSMPSFDEALKNANSHNQKVAKALQLGIVANPLKV